MAGTGRVECEWPPEKSVDIGSFYADWSKFSDTTGWAPSIASRRAQLTIAFTVNTGRTTSTPRWEGAAMNAHRIPFMSLVPGEDATAVKQAIDRVIERGWFVLDPKSRRSRRNSTASGAAHAIGVSTGTDALA